MVIKGIFGYRSVEKFPLKKTLIYTCNYAKVKKKELVLPFTSILGSFNSAANKNMMSKIWTNGVQLSVGVENIVEIGGIARHEQFLLLPQCFKKLSIVDASK